MALRFKGKGSFEEIINSPECLSHSGKVIVDQEKVDWKEWLPYWGLYQIYKDKKNGKPTVDDPRSLLVFFGAPAYHAAITMGSALYVLHYLTDKF